MGKKKNTEPKREPNTKTTKKKSRGASGKRPARSKSAASIAGVPSTGSMESNDVSTAADHQSIEFILDSANDDSHLPNEYVGEILHPFTTPTVTSNGVPSSSGETKACDANLELLGGNLSPEIESFVDSWYGTFGSSTSQALVQSDGGTRIQELLAEVIIDTDDRVRVHQTHQYPFSALCFLEITARNGRPYVGTGWLIDPVTVITAGNCVYLHRQGGWADSIRVFPGRNGFQKPVTHSGRSLMSVRGWVQDGLPASDYGAIRLKQPVENVGSFGFRTATSEDLKRFNCQLIGYPVDKRGEMWGHVRRLREVLNDILIYDVDTYGGNSGGPIVVVEDGNVLVVGIHNDGDLSGNSATRITDRVFDNLESWKEA